jgi:hypothetical protein
MLAHAYLAAMATRAADQATPAQKGIHPCGQRTQNPDDHELIALTVNEIRHLLAILILAAEPIPDRVFSWSNWRRRRQAQARRCHYKQRGHIPP